ncbi:FliH/SctL family protein [Polycladidibacter stylochi]|uniref:FliH/SctL family protein n=1 Tax=Polycladidibacter stylochi TaxID=1807766 RepID=UPI0008298D39|nr:FliH/SctL family protein [Pseudovibrio stylochi]
MVSVLRKGVTPARFLFDTDFSAPEINEEPVMVVAEPMISVKEHEALLAQARSEGFAEGQREAEQRLSGAHKAHVDALADKLEGIVRKSLVQLDAELLAQEKRAAELSIVVARKLCEHLVAREPIGEVVALLTACLAPLRKTPSLVVMLPQEDAEELAQVTDQLVARHSFEGRLQVLGVEGMQQGNCRIEWPEGGINRDMAMNLAKIEKAIANYFEARSNGDTDGAMSQSIPGHDEEQL